MVFTLQVIVLIDGGSTHNFLQTRLASHLAITVHKSPHMNVTVGDSAKLRCDGMCRSIKLVLEKMVFGIDLFLLPIYGVDIVLGVQWLVELGRVMFDYKELYMEFLLGIELIRLHGIRRGSISAISGH